jgi:hypothetical protein
MPSLSTAATSLGLIAIGLVLGALGVTSLVRGRRESGPAKRAAREPTPRPEPTAAQGRVGEIQLRIPMIQEGEPDVWGVNDALDVIVQAPTPALPTLVVNGQTVPPLPDPAAGGATAPSGGNAAPRGVARFRLVSSQPARWVIVAEAAEARAPNRAAREIRIVDYRSEIQELFRQFHEWAIQSFPEAQNALTAREVLRILKGYLGEDEASGSLLEATRDFELVAYGERTADRTLYLAVLRALANVKGAAERLRPESGSSRTKEAEVRADA